MEMKMRETLLSGMALTTSLSRRHRGGEGRQLRQLSCRQSTSRIRWLSSSAVSVVVANVGERIVRERGRVCGKWDVESDGGKEKWRGMCVELKQVLGFGDGGGNNDYEI
ncbi:hypothetical protein RIF29_22890 [Crotalaria pallida]|uniref:Uncharacterized protein n=1 Tax=Crotalaria pallida TaxID=3830 RepID=A0AAN9F9F9_CROPI